MKTVLIVEDNVAYSQSLSQMLCEEEGIQVLAVVRSGREVIEAAERLRPDVVLMDIDLPGQEGLQATQTLRERWPAVQVVILTLHSSEAFRRWAGEVGAAAFLSKDADPEGIVQAVRGAGRT